VDSNKGKEMSGITEGDPRLHQLEKQRLNMSDVFKNSMQQIDSRQQNMDKNYQDLYNLIHSALRVSALPKEPRSPAREPPVSSQLRTPPGKDNQPTRSDEAGDLPEAAGNGS